MGTPSCNEAVPTLWEMGFVLQVALRVVEIAPNLHRFFHLPFNFTFFPTTHVFASHFHTI